MKRFIALFLTAAMILSVIGCPQLSENSEDVQAATFAITSPEEGELKAAGYMDITWTTSSSASSYKVYMDGSLQGTTTDTTFEVYTTEVSSHTAYVTAVNSSGSTVATSATITFYVTKKGLAVSSDMGVNLDPEEMGVAWYYNWGTSPFSWSSYSDLEFVPMQWGSSSSSNISNNVSSWASSGYKYCLGFNEPDSTSQSNISVTTALSLWSSFMNKGIYVGSPVDCYWGATDWFQSFMEGIEADDSLDVDFITVHAYPENYSGSAMAKWFMGILEDLYETYGKPIWITEYSCIGSSVTSESTLEWIETVMPLLDECEYVERYAFFNFTGTEYALWTNSTGELTEVGEAFASLGNPDGYTAEASDDNYTYTSTSSPSSVLGDTTTINGVTCEDYAASSGVSIIDYSSEYGGNLASYMIDDSISTRWESEQGVDPQYFTVDLGQTRSIKQICIVWEGASAASYTVEISTDGTNWTTVATIDSSTGAREDIITFTESVSARYVRITGTSRTTIYGYSIYDLAIYGTSDSSVDTTTVKTTTTTTKTTTTVRATTTTTSAAAETSAAETETTAGTSGNEDSSDGGGASTLTETTASASADSAGISTKTKIKKAKYKKTINKIKISLKKVSGAVKYKVKVSSKKKFKKKNIILRKTIKSKKKVSSGKFKIKSKEFKTLKKVYIKARAIAVVNGKKYKGKWSKRKKVKIKK